MKNFSKKGLQKYNTLFNQVNINSSIFEKQWTIFIQNLSVKKEKNTRE